MAADALALFVTGTSAAMILTLWNGIFLAHLGISACNPFWIRDIIIAATNSILWDGGGGWMVDKLYFSIHISGEEPPSFIYFYAELEKILYHTVTLLSAIWSFR